jgi:hypothetical protein
MEAWGQTQHGGAGCSRGSGGKDSADSRQSFANHVNPQLRHRQSCRAQVHNHDMTGGNSNHLLGPLCSMQREWPVEQA